MYGLYKKLTVGVCAFVLVGNIVTHTAQLQLVHHSYEQCVEKAQSLRFTFTCQRYLRAGVKAAVATALLYVLHDYLVGSGTVWRKFFSTSQSPKSTAPWFSWEWLAWENVQHNAWVFSKAFMQSFCAHWLTQKVMHNNAAPKNYLPTHIERYVKLHCVELERLMKLRAAEGGMHADTDLLIQGHLQALVDTIEQLVAYMVAYAKLAHVLSHTQLLVEQYAQEVMHKTDRIVEHFNATHTSHFEDAVLTFKKACLEIIVGASCYVRSSLPSDE